MYRERITRETRAKFEQLVGKIVRVETDESERVGTITRISGCDVFLDGPNGEDESFCTSYQGPFLVTTIEDRWTGPGDEPRPSFNVR